MINVRSGIFETNSSSTHSLCIIKNDLYKKWRNHEIVVKIEYNWSPENDKGDNGLFGTWGNFFCERGKLDWIPIEEQHEKNIEILTEYISKEVYKYYTGEELNNKLRVVEEYFEDKNLAKLFQGVLIDLYCTPEEYLESLRCGDCDSPFIYKGDEVVVLGHYCRT